MFRRIIVAYDGSDRAQDALALALRLRDPEGGAVSDETALMLAAARAKVPAGIRVSLRVPVASSPARAVTEADERDALRGQLRAQEMLDEAADAAPTGVNPRTLLLHGAAGKAIADACDGIVDLLVTGSRGYGAVQRALMGSVAEALLEGAAHPVLVLPRTAAGRISEHAGAEA